MHARRHSQCRLSGVDPDPETAILRHFLLDPANLVVLHAFTSSLIDLAGMLLKCGPIEQRPTNVLVDKREALTQAPRVWL